MGLAVGKGLPVNGPLQKMTGLKSVPGGAKFVKRGLKTMIDKAHPKV